ncbi:MAG: ChbG/HpnK family deacetylase [Spirochaeta sp.]
MSDKHKGVVLTSDDLGMHPAINRGIIRALSEGRISVTNIMVPCPSAREAVREIVEHGLPCGVHLTLTSEWEYMRTRPLTGAGGLCGPDGTMWRTHRDLAAAASDQEILQEMIAQIERAMEWGLTPTHLDIHMIPAGSPVDPAERRVLRLAERAGEGYGLNCTYSGEGSPDDGAKSRHFDSAVSTAGQTPQQIDAWLSGLAPGVHHLTLHLSEDSDDLHQLSPPGNPWLKNYRDDDTRLLYDFLPAAMEKYGFRLLHPSDLPEIYRTS